MLLVVPDDVANAPGATPMGLVPGAFPASDFGAANATLSNATLSPPALDFADDQPHHGEQPGGRIFSNFLTGIASDQVWAQDCDPAA